MKSLPLHFKQLSIAAGIVLLVVLVMDYNTRLDDLSQLNQKAATVRVQATEAMRTQVALQTQIARATSAQVTEYESRENGEILEGDQRVVLIPIEGAPLIDTPVSSPPPERIKKWQVWLELFFGE